MTIWTDAQLSPAIAIWISRNFPFSSIAVRDLGLRDATDLEIFQAAKRANVVVMTKDKDFINLLDRFGPPPQVIWLTCGNTSNTKLQEILSPTLTEAIALFESGERIVEISSV